MESYYYSKVKTRFCKVRRGSSGYPLYVFSKSTLKGEKQLSSLNLVLRYYRKREDFWFTATNSYHSFNECRFKWQSERLCWFARLQKIKAQRSLP